MRRLLFNLHLYLALIAGVFVVIFGITGSIMAFEPEIDHLLHSQIWYVKPGGQPLSLARLTAAVAKVFPGEPINGFTLSTEPDLSYQLSMKRGGVYVNQYTGEVLGVRTGGPDLLATIHQLHLRLAWRRDGDPGKTIMSWAGLIVLFLSISGAYLWWPTKRLTITRGAKGRRFWFDAHSMVGIFSFAFILELALTGVLIGFDDMAVPLLYKATGSQPSEQPKIPAPPLDGKPISPDAALEIARSALPGTTPFAINVPGPKGSYVVRSRYPEDLTPGGRSRVVVDQYTGSVIFTEGSRTAPAGTRLVIVNRAIHTGDIFGIPGKTVASLASLMLVAQLVTGVIMWRKRKS